MRKVNLLSIFLSLASIMAYGADMEDVYIVGQWGFTSDHLIVVGDIVFDEEKLSIGSFNVLNENVKHYIEKGQKLGGSTLFNMGQPQRDLENVALIKRGLEEGVAIFALQECNAKFIDTLQEKLKGSDYVLRQAGNQAKDDYGVVIYDQKRLLLVSEDANKKYHTEDEENESKNYIHTLRFRHLVDGQEFSFINTHSPFGLTHQFREHLLTMNGFVVAVGDLNVGNPKFDPRPQSDINEELLKNLTDYTLLESARYSHVNTFQNLDLFDHILYKGIKVVKNADLTNSLRREFSLKNRD